MQAYCFQCEVKTDIKNIEPVTLKDGRAAARGVCSVCGAKVFGIGKHNLNREMANSNLSRRLLPMS